MEKKGRERRRESDRPCTSRDFLRSRKRELCDRLWLGGEGFQQFRQRPVAASGGLKTRVLAIFGNHYRGNPRRPGAIADPWYTGNFDATFTDVMEGCSGLLKYLKSQWTDENY